MEEEFELILPPSDDNEEIKIVFEEKEPEVVFDFSNVKEEDEKNEEKVEKTVVVVKEILNEKVDKIIINVKSPTSQIIIPKTIVNNNNVLLKDDDVIVNNNLIQPTNNNLTQQQQVQNNNFITPTNNNLTQQPRQLLTNNNFTQEPIEEKQSRQPQQLLPQQINKKEKEEEWNEVAKFWFDRFDKQQQKEEEKEIEKEEEKEIEVEEDKYFEKRVVNETLKTYLKTSQLLNKTRVQNQNNSYDMYKKFDQQQRIWTSLDWTRMASNNLMVKLFGGG